MNRFKNFGFTLIEMIISLFIATLVITAVATTFQNFTSFNNWIIHYSYTQKHAAYELSVFKKLFANFTHMLSSEALGLSLEKVLFRSGDHLGISLLSFSADGADQISATDDEGKLSIHQGFIQGGMAKDGNALYVVDTGNHVIRKIDTVLQTMSVFAGDVTHAGSTDATGTLALFRNPTGIVAYNNALYVVDTGNHAIRKIDIATQEVTTFAGTLGVSGNVSVEKELSYFSYPTAIAIDSSTGDFYVADTGNHLVKKISGGIVSVLLGTVGESGKNYDTIDATGLLHFSLYSPTSLVFDSNLHVLYINDYENKRILSLEEDEKVFTVDSGKYFGSLQMYDDALSYHYVLYQEMESGDVRFYKPVDKEHGLFFNAKEDVSIYPENYWMHSFLYDSGVYFMWGLRTTDNQWGIFQIDPLADSISTLFGVSGEYGSLSLFDVSAHVFSSFSDFIGDVPVIYFHVRENPTSVRANEYEFLLSYYFGDDKEDASSKLHYSLILGDE